MTPPNPKSNLPKITDQSEEDLIAWAVEQGEKPFRAAQVFQWLYLHKVTSPEAMLNISKKFRQKLTDSFRFERIRVIEKNQAPDGTVKFLQELEDGKKIESVLMNHNDHYTVCVSTQVGCAMGCRFCMTAQMGLIRNLSPGEIVEQVLNANAMLPEGDSVRNIVYMGMGEPFHNYQNTMTSLGIFLNSNGFGLSSRRITVSTSGIVPGIKQFAAEGETKANLAISLNGVTQEARQHLMPVSRRHSLEDLMKVCREFPREARQRITFEYILMAGLTDSIASAKKLVTLLHGTKSKVNLIPFNETPELPYKRPSEGAIRRFQDYLRAHGVLATVRISKGQGISAACGQLAVKSIESASRRSDNTKTPDHPESC